MHRDEFEKNYHFYNANYPSSYISEKGEITLLISDEEMNSVKNLDEMEALILSKLNTE